MSAPKVKDAIHVYVLYMDIVDSTRATVDKQDQVNTRLRDLVRSTHSFQEASSRNELISLPTGDGMALVFLRKLDGPLQCALEITEVLRHDPFCRLRMGIHSGSVIVEDDITDRPNVSGDGISLAARVMSCGGAGHILLTRNAADLVRNLEAWKGKLRRLGTYQIKKDQVEVWNYLDGDVGSSAALKLQPAARQLSRKLWIAAVLVVAIIGVTFFAYNRSHGPVPPQPAATHTAADMSLGLNLWRMRLSPQNAEVKKRGLSYRADPTGKKSWTPERVALQGSVREGDNIRMTLQSFQVGYLYVINRDLYRGGARSAPTLIFPNTQIRGGDNYMRPGVVLGIPSINDNPPTFTVERTRPDQTSILILLIMAPQTLPGIVATEGQQQLPDSLVADWEKKWGANVTLMENVAMAGQLFTNGELQSEQTRIPTPGPPPMTIFSKKTALVEPLLATAEIRVLDR